MTQVLNHGLELTTENAALLMVDHQTGISNGVTDMTQTEFRNNVIALAKVGRMFNLPTVFTTSAADGPNGPLLAGLQDILPNAPVVHRPGEINAFHNPDFVKAVEATGRKKLIIAGVSTDVCVAFAAISAKAAGYDVYAVIDASGTWGNLAQETSVQRMIQAGVVPMSWVAVAAELQKDWRKETGEELAKIMGEHLPYYGNVLSSYFAAKA